MICNENQVTGVLMIAKTVQYKGCGNRSSEILITQGRTGKSRSKLESLFLYKYSSNEENKKTCT